MDRTDMTHRMYDIKGPLVAKKFEARGFEAVYCPTVEEALNRLFLTFRKRMSSLGAARLRSMKSVCVPMSWNTIR